MGLRKGESWDDYIGKNVYVTQDFGETGHLAKVISYNPDGFVLIENTENNEVFNIEEEFVYGRWNLEDW